MHQTLVFQIEFYTVNYRDFIQILAFARDTERNKNLHL